MSTGPVVAAPWESGDGAVEFRALMATVRRQRWVLVGSTVLVALAALVFGAASGSEYRASAKVHLVPADPTQQLGAERSFASEALADRYVKNEIEIIKRDPEILAAAVTVVGGLSPKQIEKRVNSRQQPDSDIVEVAATDKSPDRAQALANAVANAYVDGQRTRAVTRFAKAVADTDALITQTERRLAELHALLSKPPPDADVEALQRERNSVGAQYEDLVGRRNGFALEERVSDGTARVLARADLPTEPVTPKPLRDAAVAGIIGLILGAALALMRERLDDTIRTPERAEATTMLRVLAELPLDVAVASTGPRLVVAERPKSELAEGIRRLHTALELAADRQPVRVLVITSAERDAGRSLIAANLAACYAMAGHRTVLVECDTENPALGLVMRPYRLRGPVPTEMSREMAPRTGEEEGTDGGGPALAPYWRPRRSESALDRVASAIETSAVAIHMEAELDPTRVPQLFFLPAMPEARGTHPEVPASRLTGRMLRRLTAFADVVVVDTPALSMSPDAAVLAAAADSTLMVASAPDGSRSALHAATKSIEAPGVRILGLALNRTEPSVRPHHPRRKTRGRRPACPVPQ